MPEVNSIAELNAMMDGWDIADDHRRIGTRPHTIGQAFTMEKPLLKPRLSGRTVFNARPSCSTT